jgi:hypothetical protein
LILVRKEDVSWLSVGLAFLSVTFSFGLNLTLGRTTFLHLLYSPLLAQLLVIASALALSTRMGYYVFSLPIAFLSYLVPVEYVSLVVLLIAVSSVRALPTFAREILLAIDAFGLTYVIFALLGIRLNPLAIPMAVVQAGAPILIPVVLFAGILYGLKVRGEDVEPQSINPVLAVLLGLVITLIPMTQLNSLHVPETVDWRYYSQWWESPTMGWFFFSRPLYLLMFFPFARLLGPSIMGELQLPVLTVLLWISSYKLGEAVKPGLGPLSSFMAVVSPTLLTFLYSGLQANLFSISLMYLSLAYIIEGKVWQSVLTSYVSMFSHIYAWAQIEGGILLFCLISFLLTRKIGKPLKTYVLFTSFPFILGFSLILTGFFSVPVGFSTSNYFTQVAFLSWGTINTFLYYLIVVYGMNSTPRIMFVIYSSSILATLFLGVVQNLIIDLPLFIPASLGISKLREDVRTPLLLFLALWALFMSLNSFPYVFQGVTI